MLYPVACAPQAWASATPFTLLEAALGLEFDAARGEIRLRDPRLPEFLNEVLLRQRKVLIPPTFFFPLAPNPLAPFAETHASLRSMDKLLDMTLTLSSGVAPP